VVPSVRYIRPTLVAHQLGLYVKILSYILYYRMLYIIGLYYREAEFALKFDKVNDPLLIFTGGLIHNIYTH